MCRSMRCLWMHLNGAHDEHKFCTREYSHQHVEIQNTVSPMGHSLDRHTIADFISRPDMLSPGSLSDCWLVLGPACDENHSIFSSVIGYVSTQASS